MAGRPSVDGGTARCRRRPHPALGAGAAAPAAPDLAGEVVARLGLDLTQPPPDGGADANLLAESGAAVLDGLGPVGGDDHTPSEWLDLTSVVPRVTLLAGLLAELADSVDRVRTDGAALVG